MYVCMCTCAQHPRESAFARERALQTLSALESARVHTRYRVKVRSHVWLYTTILKNAEVIDSDYNCSLFFISIRHEKFVLDINCYFITTFYHAPIHPCVNAP